MLPFCCHKGLSNGEKPYFTGFFTGANLFPLHRCGGLGRDVIDYTVDVLYFVGDAVADAGEDVIGDLCPVGGHEVVGRDGTDGDEVIVGAVVAHDTDGAHARQHAEKLRQVLFIAVFRHFIPQHPVGVLQDLHLFGGDLADDAHAESRAGERLTPHKLMRDAELFADAAHLVLEQVAKRLDDAEELHVVRHLHLVVMRFDLVGVALAGFDAVGVDRALREKALFAAAATDLFPKHFVKLCADDVPLLFGIGDPFEAGQEMLLTVHAH